MSDFRPIDVGYDTDWTHAAATFVNDLDRCEHGRHRVDDCSMCANARGSADGQSRGNPRARGEDPRTADGLPILGYDLGGNPYVLVVPERGDRSGTTVRRMPREVSA